jgi:peptidoglycan/xylan/chitin deacetylase (PgdA/CDA1 family)
VARTQAVSLIYHDVVDGLEHQRSGFPWPDAAIYKLEPVKFVAHMKAIAQVLRGKPDNVLSLNPAERRVPFFLTFDDGGVSAYSHVADQLDSLGWVGHFFVSTGYIGQPSFLSRHHIRELVRRGHVVGSHSHTHPLRMASCPPEELRMEWQTSVEIISEIIGARVRVASVPGGYYSRRVAEAASLAGIEVLFNSEPTTTIHRVDGCMVLGRYGIQHRTAPGVAASLAAGQGISRIRQGVLWNIKKGFKRVGGGHYLTVRRIMIDKIREFRCGRV